MSYIPIASQTLTANAASVTFSAIPQTFRDLIVVTSAIRSSVADLRITINGDTTDSSYPRVTLIGFGTSQSSGFTNTRQIGLGSPASDRPVNIQHIMDYSQTNKHKSILWRVGVGLNSTRASATRWSNTAAITSLSYAFSVGDLEAGSIFSLYGIEA